MSPPDRIHSGEALDGFWAPWQFSGIAKERRPVTYFCVSHCPQAQWCPTRAMNSPLVLSFILDGSLSCLNWGYLCGCHGLVGWWVGGRPAGWGWSHSCVNELLDGLTVGLLSPGSLTLKEAVLGFLMWWFWLSKQVKEKAVRFLEAWAWNSHNATSAIFFQSEGITRLALTQEVEKGLSFLMGRAAENLWPRLIASR